MLDQQNQQGAENVEVGGNSAAAVAAARPKVKELLQAYRSNPSGGAAEILESLLVSQMAGAAERETQVLLLLEERGIRHGLEDDFGRHAKRLERQNRQLKRDLHERVVTESRVREYLEQAAHARTSQEITHQEIFEKISAVIGVGGPLIPRVEKGFTEGGQEWGEKR